MSLRNRYNVSIGPVSVQVGVFCCLVGLVELDLLIFKSLAKHKGSDLSYFIALVAVSQQEEPLSQKNVNYTSRQCNYLGNR